MTAPARDTQLSLVDGMERPVGPLPMSVQSGTNADLIAKIAPLYLTGSVLDVTYGRGKWWDRFTPDPFVFHDLHTVDGVDFRALPHADDSFDTVCFDPPYVPSGTKPQTVETSHRHTAGDFRERFGLEPMSHSDIFGLFSAGAAECARVARRWVLAKCSDFVTGGVFTLGHVAMLDAARAADLTIHDLIVHHTGTGPGGHNITTIKRARRAHSYLLVFSAEGGRR